MSREPEKKPSAWSRHSGKMLLAAMAVSALFHVLSGVQLGRYVTDHQPAPRWNGDKVKIKIVQVPPKKKAPEPEKKPEEEKKDDPELKKLLETPQAPTEAPKEADYLGTVDHIAKKETRIADKIPRPKAADAGQKGKPDANDKPKVAEQKPPKEPPKKDQKPLPPSEPTLPTPKNPAEVRSTQGGLAFGSAPRKPRNEYEALLPSQINDLAGQVDAGYQDFVDDKVQEGDRIDINTTEYRFIGYFTNLRKAIELVWNYPMEASRRGMQGEVGLEFTIAKDGTATRVRVIKSSGYEILDTAIVEAIKLASPFAPLPDGFKKQKITVTGSFRYILTAFGSH